MIPTAQFVVLCLFEMAYACLPTQQIEATTTTEAPGPASPCVTCQKVYDTSCTGYVAGTSSCATSSQAAVSYDIGFAYTEQSFHYYDDNACLMTFKCPAGTNVVVDAYGAATPPTAELNEAESGFCVESGDEAGQWYYAQIGQYSEFYSFKIKSFKCAA